MTRRLVVPAAVAYAWGTDEQTFTPKDLGRRLAEKDGWQHDPVLIRNWLDWLTGADVTTIEEVVSAHAQACRDHEAEVQS